MMKLLEKILRNEGRFFTRLTDAENVAIGQFGNGNNALVDPITKTISAGVNAFNYPVTLTDTGTAAMTGITAPYATFAGRITIIPGGAFTWTNATNIAKAGTAVANVPIDFIYNPITGKWYALRYGTDG